MIFNFIDAQTFALLSTWTANFFFLIALFPQLYLNYRLKTTSGLSDLMLLGYFNGYIADSFYVLCLNLPLANKILVPAGLFTIILIICQRFYYGKDYKKDRILLFIYLVNATIVALLIPIAVQHRLLIGNVSGWIMMILWAIYQIPQIIKLLFERSTFGFSFWLTTLVGIGDIIEFIYGIILNLPAQTIINDVRGILIYLVFCVQFALLSHKRPKHNCNL